MLVSVISFDFRRTLERCSFEKLLIFKHQTLHPRETQYWLAFVSLMKRRQLLSLWLFEIERVYTRLARKLPRTRKSRSSCASRLLVRGDFRASPNPGQRLVPAIFVKLIWQSDQLSVWKREKLYWVRGYQAKKIRPPKLNQLNSIPSLLFEPNYQLQHKPTTLRGLLLFSNKMF